MGPDRPLEPVFRFEGRAGGDRDQLLAFLRRAADHCEPDEQLWRNAKRNKFPAIIQNKLQHGERITVHGDSETTGSRYYIHSRNSADAFIHILKLKPPHRHVAGDLDKPDRYNIVPDACVKNDDLVFTIAQMMGIEFAPIDYQPFTAARPGHDRHYGLDGAKLAATGWKQPLSFEDSLCNTVTWQAEHPEWLEPK